MRPFISRNAAVLVAGLSLALVSSPVLFVPSLAEVPESITAPVYVFANGPTGMGNWDCDPMCFRIRRETPSTRPCGPFT